jgi:hypothetical protein
MWPTGGDSHPNDPDKRFVQIKIPVVIDVPDWFDYDAEIWLWFYLYIGATPLGGGNLRGRVDPIVKTRKWGQLRWGWPFSSGNERRDERAKRPVLLAFRGVTPS